MSQTVRKMICIRCPRGCEIDTTIDGYTVSNIKGNFCKLGEEYVRTEIIDPRRILTTTIKVLNGKYPLVPVWTSGPIPKDKIGLAVKELGKITLSAPVSINQIVIENLLELGISVNTSGKVDYKPDKS